MLSTRKSNIWPMLICSALTVGQGISGYAQAPTKWKAHDLTRPRPPVVTPALQKLPVPPPSDAVVLFDGRHLSHWQSEDGRPARWVIRDDTIESIPDSGYLYSVRSFGDVQLHVEWAAPVPAEGSGQGRGNSGVFFMTKYEVQVLDSYQNDTYPDGQAAAVYGQYPPLVNACLPPGEWQAFDIVFRRPRFDRTGALEKPARLTVLHNGILVQDNVALWGPTMWLQHLPYESHADKLPLSLQDHGNPVRYRNIWLRELPEWQDAGPATTNREPRANLTPETLDRYAGKYEFSGGGVIEITRHGSLLRWRREEGPPTIDLVPHSTKEFAMRWTAGKVVFELDNQENPQGFTFHLSGKTRTTKRID